MKTKQLIIAAATLCGMLYSTTSYAVYTEKTYKNVSVSFSEKDSYTDIASSMGHSKKGEDYVLKTIYGEFGRSAQKYLKDGYTLQVDVSDIDLAGDRSQLTSEFGEYRVYRDVFPPRIAFTYSVVDESDQVVASGQATLSDMNYRSYLRSPSFDRGEPAPYVRELIRNWATSDLKKALQAN